MPLLLLALFGGVIYLASRSSTTAPGPRTTPATPPAARAVPNAEALDAARDKLISFLGALPWFSGAGISSDAEGPTVSVLVDKLTDAIRELVPKTVDGVRVVLVEVGEIVAHADDPVEPTAIEPTAIDIAPIDPVVIAETPPPPPPPPSLGYDAPRTASEQFVDRPHVEPPKPDALSASSVTMLNSIESITSMLPTYVDYASGFTYAGLREIVAQLLDWHRRATGPMAAGTSNNFRNLGRYISERWGAKQAGEELHQYADMVDAKNAALEA